LILSIVLYFVQPFSQHKSTSRGVFDREGFFGKVQHHVRKRMKNFTTLPKIWTLPLLIGTSGGIHGFDPFKIFITFRDKFKQ
jgi:hypothetical protein